MPKVVLDLNDRRPAWALPPWVAGEIQAALPEGWTLQRLDSEADGSGDGMARLSPELAAVAPEMTIYLGYGVPADLLVEATQLRWAHSGAAGVGSSLTPEMLASPVIFTNSKGIHGPPMADTALGMILFFARGLDFGVHNKVQSRWNTEPFYRADHPLTEMSRSTVGILGFGGIGREVARRLRALDARVLAYDQGPEAFTSSGRVTLGDEVDLGDPGLEMLHGEAGLRRLLEESDFLVLTAPETQETRGILDRAALGLMKGTGVLINLSRGCLVEEDALIEALTKGRIRGAGLDVYHQEPLPADHPLWKLPNVLMTPHVSAVSGGFWRRQADLIVENLRRYFSGETLLNLVDKEAGF
jgi:phosphoglycerate dehydrogenase-like enzyme